VSTDLAANIRDTFPGRLLLEWHLHWRTYHPEHRSARAYADSITTEDYSGRVGMTLSSYLYGDGFKDVLAMDTSTAEVVEMSEAITTVLTSPRCHTWTSPQHHHGRIRTLHQPAITNRRLPSALLDGAFWAAPMFAGADAWALHGEHDRTRSPHRYEVHFDPDTVRVAHIASAEDWFELLSAHPLIHGDTLFPDWPSIATEWDAVHVSINGLLCAQPLNSHVPYDDSDPSGFTHSQSGPYVGLGEWTVPSAAWLRLPEHVTVRPAGTDLPHPRVR